MELYKLSDQELRELCILQERVADSVFPEIMNLINFPFTVDKERANIDENTGEVQPVIIPQIEMFSFYLSPIEEMESEMENRGILEDYRDNMPFIDYENACLLVYESFCDRLSHLFYLHDRGFLTDENIRKVTDILNPSANASGLLS